MRQGVGGVILGLPWTTWLLLVAAVGGGVAVELWFYRRERGRGAAPRSPNLRQHR